MTGAVVTSEAFGSGSDVSTSVQNFPNNWYRVSLSGKVNSASTDTRLVIYLQSNLTAFAASYAGNNTSGVYLYGAQLEAGSFPTSYIPTSGSTATRAADVASIPTSAFGYNQKAGTVVVEWNSPDDTAHIVNLNTDASNRWVILKDAGNQKSFISDGGAAVMNVVIAAAPSGDNKSGMSVSSASGNGVINGGSVVSDTSVSVPNATTLSIGKDEASNYYLNGHIKSIQYYPRRLTNTQLQELTS